MTHYTPLFIQWECDVMWYIFSTWEPEKELEHKAENFSFLSPRIFPRHVELFSWCNVYWPPEVVTKHRPQASFKCWSKEVNVISIAWNGIQPHMNNTQWIDTSTTHQTPTFIVHLLEGFWLHSLPCLLDIISPRPCACDTPYMHYSALVKLKLC